MTNPETTHLNIVSFNNPYPPDLGGLIDVYYRIKQLHAKGILIHFHTFNYDREENKAELEKLCASITFYKRRKNIINFLSTLPFIIKSRKDNALLQNLCSNPYPILFEGTHCCAFLNHPALEGRYKMVRMHNVESDYYALLAKSESSFFKKIYNRTEAIKLRWFDKNLAGASAIATVSEEDTKHYRKINSNTILIPSSHQFDEVQVKKGKGDYAFYHGNLSVPENIEAAFYLINKVFGNTRTPLIIAGKNPTEKLRREIEKYKNIRLVASPPHEEMEDLLANAHVLVLPTFQSTGLKLKLLYSLFRGRFCVVNDTMLVGTHLRPHCYVANTPLDMQFEVQELMNKEFGQKELKDRQALQTGIYSNDKLVDAWIKLISQEENKG